MYRIFMQTLLICVFPAAAFSQLRFPVSQGYILENTRILKYSEGSAQEIRVETDDLRVYSSESGWVLNIFDIEGDQYMLIHGNYYIAYGPFDTVMVKRMDSIGIGHVLGKLARTPGQPKSLDMMIMKNERDKLLLKDVFPEYLRKIQK